MAGGDNDTQLIQAKLAKLGLDQTPEEFVASLDPPIKRRVEALQELQGKHDELQAQFRKERAELEAKYEKLYAPLYVERSDIVQGAKEVPAKEGDAGGDESIKGIPEFWLTVLLKCEVTMDIVKDKDMDVLKYLRDIQAESLVEDGVSHGFKLKFYFDTNPYFTNSVLEKTYHMLPEDDGVLERAEGTKIEWAPGKDVTVKIMKKKPKKGKADAKPQVKTERVDSFFNFFDPPQVPDGEEEIDEDTMEELQAIIEADYEVGATIREKLIPEAVSWYTGEAVDEEGMLFGGDDEDEDEDFEGEEGEEDEDEDDGAAGGEGQGAAGGQQQQPPECKQQ